ncbi:NfeD family protein [Neisseriaceae bacterium CLB008]|nr:NfeD family protein [Neisseriaceae bacterium]
MIWFAFALIFLMAELFSTTLYLLVMSIALFTAGFADVLLGTSTALNFGIVAAMTFLGCFIAYQYNKKRKQRRSHRTDDLDLQQIVSIEGISPSGEIEVRYRGAIWQARFTDHNLPTDTQQAIIVGKEGNLLIIQSI